MAERVNIIAEIGSNYDSDLETAKKYILAAKDSGADTVKFQTLRKAKLIAPKVHQNEEWTLVGIGTVVLNDVPYYAKVVGNPVRVIGKVD